MTANLMAATALTPGVQFSGQLSTTAETTIFTCPGASSIKIQSWALCNTSGAAVVVNASILASGQGTGTGTHRVISGYSLAAGDTIDLVGICGAPMLGPGDFLTVTAATANVVDVVVTGAVGS